MVVILWLSYALFALYAWDLLVSLAGLLPLRRPKPAPSFLPRFAVLIPAHNEARVVAGIVGDMVKQNYPRQRFDLIVVADNCDDDTAQVARAAGAEVIERRHPTDRTKGYALQHGIAALRTRGGYDALCVFDADNAAPANFLATMRDYLADRHVAIQAYLDTKNPFDSWVTRAIALAYFVTNRFWMRARFRLGLPATLGGTGLCLAWDVVERFPWDPGSLSDDLELSMHLIEAGQRVSYCPHTRTYDEKPVTLRQSVRQRSRWMQGHNDVARRWVPRLLAALARRPFGMPTLRRLDAILYLLQPLRVLLAFLCLTALVSWAGADDEARRALAFGAVGLSWAALVFVVYPLLLAAMERVPARLVPSVPLFLLFGFSWIPAICVGLLRMRRRVWLHTEHGRR